MIRRTDHVGYEDMGVFWQRQIEQPASSESRSDLFVSFHDVRNLCQLFPPKQGLRQGLLR